ncbi:MAG: hypothetical protein ACFFD4_02310 [Candidatus Odinarchaeota archaeon]
MSPGLPSKVTNKDPQDKLLDTMKKPVLVQGKVSRQLTGKTPGLLENNGKDGG